MAKPIKVWDGTIWQDIAIQAPSLGGYATTVDLTAHAIDTTGIHGISDTANLIVSTGSYADPSWITSLAKSKVGLGSVENTAISTWAGSANITTIGNSATGTLTIESTARIDTTSTSVTANTATTISTLASATFRSAEYLVQITQGTKYTTSKIMMSHDGTTAHITEYALLELGASRIPLTISGTLSAGNVLLQATITDAATTNAAVKVVKTSIVV